MTYQPYGPTDPQGAPQPTSPAPGQFGQPSAPPYGQGASAYPPQQPPAPFPGGGFTAPAQQDAVERPKQVVMAGILAYAIGAIGLLSVLMLIISITGSSSPGYMFNVGIALSLLAPVLSIVMAVLGMLFVRGSGGARVTFIVLAIISLLLDVFGLYNTISALVAWGSLPGFPTGTVIANIVLGVAVAAVQIVAVIMLAGGAAGRWFTYKRTGRVPGAPGMGMGHGVPPLTPGMPGYVPPQGGFPQQPMPQGQPGQYQPGQPQQGGYPQQPMQPGQYPQQPGQQPQQWG